MVVVVNLTTITIVINKIKANIINIGVLDFRYNMFDWIVNLAMGLIDAWDKEERINRIMYVKIIIIDIVIMLIDWLGVKDTKYENITNIPLI